MDEFSLIGRYFSALTEADDSIVLGIGDDCAQLRVPPAWTWWSRSIPWSRAPISCRAPHRGASPAGCWGRR
ncbi:hypothetical protein [Marinobacterium aestuariivivens]|uniref:PurM-like N-terminal domain-containing protein n=1 Tax=Marinobacterium aestuariivivens TaxID=1698799 RepID=A0ABW1ZYE5_9GAMM